jgi:hypothetical protein
MKTPKRVHNRSSEIAIFGRLLQAEKDNLSHNLARYLLTLGFPEQDQARMSDLADRNQQSLLAADEKDELQNYVRASHLLALLHSKARKSLKRRRAS